MSFIKWFFKEERLYILGFILLGFMWYSIYRSILDMSLFDSPIVVIIFTFIAIIGATFGLSYGVYQDYNNRNK